MYCPFCDAEDTKVTDSRLVNTGSQVWRRRECLTCGERFTTYESVEFFYPRVIKRDGTRVLFAESKLRAGIMRSMEKRPVESECVEQAINRLLRKIRMYGEKEIASHTIGEWVMEELQKIDEVAYVRFASVYRRFQDVSQFHQEIIRMQERRTNTEEPETTS